MATDLLFVLVPRAFFSLGFLRLYTCLSRKLHTFGPVLHPRMAGQKNYAIFWSSASSTALRSAEIAVSASIALPSCLNLHVSLTFSRLAIFAIWLQHLQLPQPLFRFFFFFEELPCFSTAMSLPPGNGS